MIEQVARRYGIEPLITLTSVGDKLFDSTVPLIFERGRAGAREAALACYEDMLESGRTMGCFPYRVGIGSMARLAGLAGNAWDIHSRLQAALDPQRIIAPSRYS
jgi:4-cresol dehydrogenase (hydroxylating) flavoprotein subunit